MSDYIMSLQQRLAGNIFENRYYLSGTDLADGIAKAQDIVTAHSLLQTADVEYVSGLLTDTLGAHVSTPFTPVVDRGSAAGSNVTLPSGTFLQFVFFSTTQKGKVSHRIRGCASNSATELGVFTIDTTGAGDPDIDAGAIPLTTIYDQYALAVATLTVDPNFHAIAASSRVAVGFKRATNRL